MNGGVHTGIYHQIIRLEKEITDSLDGSSDFCFEEKGGQGDVWKDIFSKQRRLLRYTNNYVLAERLDGIRSITEAYLEALEKGRESECYQEVVRLLGEDDATWPTTAPDLDQRIEDLFGQKD